MFMLFNLPAAGILHSHEDGAGLYDSVQGLLLSHPAGFSQRAYRLVP